MLNELVNNTNNFESFVFFLVFNTMGGPFNKIINAYNDLKACELNRLNSLTTMKVYLLIIGIVILCFGFLLLAIYLFIIDKHLNSIWELLRIRTRNSFFEIRKNVEDRIFQIHAKQELWNSNIDSSILKNGKPLKFRHSFRTISRFSIIFIIALCFTFIQYFVFEQNLQISLQYHTTLISSVMNRKMLATKLGFFVLESNIGRSNCSLPFEFSFYNDLATPRKSITSIYNQLLVNIQGMENPTTVKVFSSTLYNYIYVSYPSNLTFLSTGTMRGLVYYMQESLYFAFHNVQSDFASFYQYFTEANAFSDAIIVIASMLSADLTNLVNSKLYDLYIFTGGFGLIFLLMYCCYYYPMLSFDIHFLNKLTDLILMIPKIHIPMQRTSESLVTQKNVYFHD